MSQSMHRMPTISASEAFQNASSSNEDSTIRLGIDGLDALFANTRSTASGQGSSTGGLLRGEVTEIVGPPGSGKTQLCLHALAAVLSCSKKAIWIDTSTKLPGMRLKQLLGPESGNDALSYLTHFTAPTLPHLMSLLLHPPAGFPPNGTALVMIDSLSALIDHTYPRGPDDRFNNNRNDDSRWLAGRRQAIMTEMGSRLSKMAVVHNIAVLTVSGTVTQIRADKEPALRPALVGQGWESSVSHQVYLYRDWLGGRKNEPARIAMKVGRSSDRMEGSDGSSVAFRITDKGIEETKLDVALAATLPPEEMAAHSRKRDRDQADDSGDDSSQEYGWDQLAAEGIVDASFL